MPEILHAPLFLLMIALAFSQKTGWLYTVSGLGVIAISLTMIPDSKAYGFPYLAIGFGMFILGVFGKGGKR